MKNILLYEFQYGLRSLDFFPFHMEEIDIEKYKYYRDNPLVLVLGGDGTQTLRAANGNAEPVENMLGVFRKKVDIISVSYNGANNNEENIDANIEKLVSCLFEPCFNKNGNRIDAQQAYKNMRQITIFAHCYGIFKILSKIEKKIIFKMQNLGYTDTEISTALGQVVSITHGGYSDLKYITEFNCVSAYDNVMKIYGESFWADIVHMLEKGEELAISEQDKNELINCYQQARKSFPKMFLAGKDRCFSYQENPHKVCIATSQLEKNELDHTNQFFMRDAENEKPTIAGDHLLQAYTCVLRLSVMNSIKNIKTPEFIKFDFVDAHKKINHIFEQLNYGYSLER